MFESLYKKDIECQAIIKKDKIGFLQHKPQLHYWTEYFADKKDLTRRVDQLLKSGFEMVNNYE